MNKSDHQGRTALFVFKVNGQDEQVLTTIAAGDLPNLGSCQVK
jgi:hypothetical protein